jgi:tetratricopeptide (TPR) repeat protein
MLGLLLAAVPARAGTSEQVPLGARAIAMGGAFTSVADDASTLFWNPAGLVEVGHQELTFSHADLFGSGIKDNYAAFVLPLSWQQAVAADWYHSGFDDDELAFGENRFDLSWARRAGRTLAAGLTGKLLTRDTDLDGLAVRQGRGWGMDAGLLVTPLEHLQVGLVAQDLLGTEIHYSSGGGSSLVYPRTLRLGASYRPRVGSIIALDVDDRIHVGGETTVLDVLALRAGVEKENHAHESLTWAMGLGFKIGMLRLDYAYQQHPVLGGTNHFGLSMAFNFNPALIRIEKVETRDLYLSLYKSYARDSFGLVRVRNLQDRPLTARVSVLVPGLMELPSQQEMLLRPKAVQELPLTAVFPGRVLGERGDRPVQVRVAATYQSQRLSRTERVVARSVAYGPGALDWSAGLGQAAAFVTITDPVVEAVARDASLVAAPDGRHLLGNRNVGLAAAIFDAVSALGVTYVPDPNNPYSAMSDTPHAVDTVHYPRQTLESRTGDCDDTTVLLAALFGNVGIPTQFVDVPGHVFLLVDTGLHERNRAALGVAEGLSVVSGEEVWIPLESTALSRGFAEAWKTGAESYASWAARGRLALVDVAQAQARYEPADLPGPAPVAPRCDAAKLQERFAADVGVLTGLREEFLAARFGKDGGRIEITPDAINQVAQVYLLAGASAKCREKLEAALALEPASARVHNNLAVAWADEGRYDEALAQMAEALASDRSDPGLWLNQGVLRYAIGDTAGAEAPLAHGLQLSGGYAQACRLLGLAADEGAGRLGSGRLTPEEARQLLKAALRKLPSPSRARSGTPSVTGAGRATTRGVGAPAGVRTGAPRAEETSPLREHLYWKE